MSEMVRDAGIYHGLPIYSTNTQGVTAVITGANGISGYYMLQVLSKSPLRWRKIYCLSRRPPYIPGGLPAHAEHIALDFLKSPQEIGKVLKDNGVKADYVFFFSYVQPTPKEGQGLWANAEELVKVNSLLLDNFIGGLTIANIKPKSFMLQTGAKNYGGHLGPTKLPQQEWDPRVELEPNFYYAQEDLLFRYAKEQNVGWNIAMPGPIVGAVPDAAMNIAFPLAVYAAVCQELEQPLEWPSDVAAWQMYCSMSNAMMNAYFEEWIALTPEAKDQKFNVCDDSSFTWEGFWPQLAGWYGIDWRGPDVNATFVEKESRFNPRGYGSNGISRRKFTLVDWAKRQDVQEAWKKLAERHDLPEKELKDIDRVFSFLDHSICRSSPLILSMDKAKKRGWHGFVDSSEGFLAVFEDLAKIKMIPPVPKVSVKFI